MCDCQKIELSVWSSVSRLYAKAQNNPINTVIYYATVGPLVGIFLNSEAHTGALQGLADTPSRLPMLDISAEKSPTRKAITFLQYLHTCGQSQALGYQKSKGHFR